MMPTPKQLIPHASQKIASEVDALLKDIREGLVEQEPQITDRLLGRIMGA